MFYQDHINCATRELHQNWPKNNISTTHRFRVKAEGKMSRHIRRTENKLYRKHELAILHCDTMFTRVDARNILCTYWNIFLFCVERLKIFDSAETCYWLLWMLMMWFVTESIPRCTQVFLNIDGGHFEHLFELIACRNMH